MLQICRIFDRFYDKSATLISQSRKEDLMKQVTTYYDDNGNIVSSRESQYKEYDEERGIIFRKKAYFYKGFKNNNKLSELGLSPIDVGRLVFLAENTYVDTNIICTYRSRKYSPATITDISKIIKVCYSRTVTFVNQLIDLGVLAKDTIKTNNTTTVHYVLSPLYFISSNYLSYHLYMTFQKQLDEVLPFKAVQFFNQHKGKPIMLYDNDMEDNNDQVE
jgi:hypothetical protein